MIRITSFLIFSQNPESLVSFYEKVFRQKPDIVRGDFKGFSLDHIKLLIGPHDKVKGKSKNPERIIFNLETNGVEKEFARIKSLGATVIQELYHPEHRQEVTVSTLADPDGNFFQIMSPINLINME